jgi:BirA family transcriptional regulator, biotin operon repressor / biotin---[acetyl-CoA-carboxylase] ligase
VTRFDVDAFHGQLQTAILGRRIETLGSVPSTQDIARDHATLSATTPDGALFTTEFQTRGRGRRDRSWSSPPGVNLLFSVVLCPRARIARPTLITLAMGGAVRSAIGDMADIATVVKWPNDVLVNGKKIAGVLTEEGKRPDGRPCWVVGVGVNVNGSRADLTGELARSATTISAESGRETSREELLARVLFAFEEQYGAMQRGELDEILRWLRRQMGGMGSAVRALSRGQVVEGAAADIDDDGALVIRTSHGALTRVEAGDDVTWL